MKSETPKTDKKPRLIHALLLRCPYCGKTKLQAKRSWLKFADGCTRCDYEYSREPGYFWGASWMINYPIVSSIVIVGAVWVVLSYPDVDGLIVALVACVLSVVLGLGLTPFGKALWLWFDHWLRQR